ncbi:two-component sensor histidine kinase [Paenibacillus pectinilyticus]|uniref:histidine kinase n=1 Tax=Paenibacillus pectinilyticus TaxID=512399 RepID=A0A1C1A6Z1_9BACL|nr:sensor histidine kinase [Paenibacillus pectinilyticus]OCT16332.1 two-component sensor histidine kinase [Paenibacillus pectinilyticus]
MPLLWVSLCILLSILTTVQLRRRITQSRELRYLQAKLTDILDQESSEKIRLHTNSAELQNLLIATNRLLDANRKFEADYTRKENAIKKMVANMSHDLKTPLTVVLGLTETIVHDVTVHEEERKRLSLKVHEKTLEILNLTNQFFDLARLESGDRPVPLTKINLSEACRNGILFYYEMIESQGLQVEVAIPEEPIYAYGNTEALGRVLQNLLSNAIRYGYEGGIVGITLQQDEDGISIEIWDQGKGIGGSDHVNVFERLYTLEDSRNQTYQGSGLGLTITKRLVELMEGIITLHSIPYVKTVFTVRFPTPRF